MKSIYKTIKALCLRFWRWLLRKAKRRSVAQISEELAAVVRANMNARMKELAKKHPTWGMSRIKGMVLEEFRDKRLPGLNIPTRRQKKLEARLRKCQ